MNARSLQGKCVVITGVAGFLGTNLLRSLIAEGARVVGVDHLSLSEVGNIRPLVGDRFIFRQGDVRDKALMADAARGTDYVVHFAEEKIPRYGGSLETLDVNFHGTEAALIAAQEAGARFILGSTDDCYGKTPETPLNEESASVLGRSQSNRYSYTISKLMAEQLAFAFMQKNGLKATVLRLFGGYGPYQCLDWRGGPQSVFITAALRNEAMQIHGDGLQTRTFTDVSDLVEGILLSMRSSYGDGEVFNIGSRDTLSIINFAYLVWRLVGREEKPRIEFVPYTDFSRNYEDAGHPAADISKAQHLLNYEPKVKLAEGIKRAIHWQSQALGIQWTAG